MARYSNDSQRADTLTLTRLMVLTAGPLVLVGVVYALSYPASHGEHATRGALVVGAGARSARTGANDQSTLAHACVATADELALKLPASCRIIVCPPFVLAGDLSESELERLHRDAVLPITSALWRAFFDHKPDEPVTIVVLRNETTYHTVAVGLDGYEPLAYAGYTQRGKRRLVCNLATGRGTLTHELAHVLASFDFPEMPEWFDEGLAALHEDATLSSDRLTLTGAGNWRSQILLEALRQGELPALETVIVSPDFRGEGEGLNYAVVRSLCHYLQERGLLSHFYRKLRGAVHDDPRGIATLCELMGRSTINEVDHEFRDWVLRNDAR